MPEPTHPPYVIGSTTIPRQLIRWLDVNPQNGALTRTQTYITIPPFSVENEWLGYSDIVAAFNVTTTNNFSLRGSFVTPTNPNYVLCIMWREGNVTHRYAMWRGVGEVFYFDVPLYSGQLIKKNFRFEVWSTDTETIVEASTLQFYTSVLGNVDYRFGVDANLGTNSEIIVDFNNVNTAIDLNDIITPVFQWLTTSGLVAAGSNLTSWTDIVGAKVLLPTGGVGVTPAIGTVAEVNAVATLNASDTQTDLTGYPSPIGLVALGVRISSSAATGILYDDGTGGFSLKYDSAGELQLWNGASYSIVVTGVQVDTWYVVIMIAGVLAVYNMSTGALLEGSGGASSLSAPSLLTIGNTDSQMLEVILAEDALDTDEFINLVGYFTQKYFTAFSLPLTFPTNSVPLTN